MATRKKKEAWPKITVGSHLTVTTYENGRTELEWDNEALDRDVQTAIANFKANVQSDKKPSKKKQR